MITYKDEDLKDIFGDKESFLHDYISEEHKNIKILDYMDSLYHFVCPVCGCEEYVEVTEADNKTYLYCENCTELIARYLDHNEYRYMQLIKENQ